MTRYDKSKIFTIYLVRQDINNVICIYFRKYFRYIYFGKIWNYYIEKYRVVLYLVKSQ